MPFTIICGLCGAEYFVDEVEIPIVMGISFMANHDCEDDDESEDDN